MTYLDTSVLVSFTLADALTARAELAVRAAPAPLVHSDLGAAEFASAVARRVRTTEITRDAALIGLATFDQWTAGMTMAASLLGSDMAPATAWLRRLDLNLRAPDAIHIAIARRLGAALLTFDARMREAAEALGCKVVQG